MKTSLLLVLVFLMPNSLLAAQDDIVKARFAIIALDPEFSTRVSFEDQLAEVLIADNYDAVSSYSLLPEITDVTDPSLREKLLTQGISIALVLRPLDIGTTATIESVQDYLAPESYRNIQEFVKGYRGDNFDTQAVIHIAGFLFDAEKSITFGQGVIWLDDEVDSREQGINKLIELVQFNLNQSRSTIRRILGLPPLSE